LPPDSVVMSASNAALWAYDVMMSARIGSMQARNASM
jgi:hypothetical protein